MATAVKMEMPVPAPAMMMGLPISEPQQTYSSPAVPVTTPGCTSSVPMPTPQSAGTTKNSQTPSPSASSAAHSASKRPARKSTLTQQQKNQKRQRATQDQLTTLEMEFNKNPTPNADTRVLIAEQINMTERSVQIWFQNRRAKIKLMAKKSLETGEDIDMIPESMRAYLAMQAAESGKGLGGAYYGRAGLMSYGPSLLLNGEQANQGKILIHHLTCRSLSIGKWMRVGQNTMDLIVFYSPDKCTMTYYINNENAGYKIEYPFSYIKNIFLDNNDDDPSKTGGIVIELNQPPNFFMDSSPSSHGFFMVGDFTENQQASQCLVHHLGGNPKVLSGQLAKLISLESFMTRHSPHNPHNMAAAAAAAAAAANTGSVAPMAAPMAAQMMQQPMGAPLGLDGPHNMSASAPVSPTARPSSQPNFIQPHVGLFQETQWGIGGVNQGMRPAPGHKRQRSRSVPMAVDFTMFQTPMPSFYIQQPGETQPQPHSANIYAPIPQPPNTMGPVNPNLRIDTQAGFGLDMRQYPMSATTAPSPSDYSSPNFFATQAPETATLPASSYNTPYSTTFLSPMMNAQNMVPPPSVSPLSFAGRSDPAIVDQSPPMTMMDRSGSADLYPLNGESAISDDGTGLNEMYSKHTINLPMHQHSPAPYGDPNQAELDMNQLVQFDAVDAASLSPESVLQNTV